MTNRKPVIAAALIAAAALAVSRKAFVLAVDGESMAPTLEPNDLLIALPGRPVRRGSIVVAEHPERPGYEMVKRVAAVPGDVVGGRALGADEFWLLGDHPPRSTDSRTFGPVKRSAIRGVVRFRYWPAPRWTRFA